MGLGCTVPVFPASWKAIWIPMPSTIAAEPSVVPGLTIPALAATLRYPGLRHGHPRRRLALLVLGPVLSAARGQATQ